MKIVAVGFVATLFFTSAVASPYVVQKQAVPCRWVVDTTEDLLTELPTVTVSNVRCEPVMSSSRRIGVDPLKKVMVAPTSDLNNDNCLFNTMDLVNDTTLLSKITVGCLRDILNYELWGF